MESINSSLIWLSLGILLIASEIFTGTFYLLLVGASSLLTALISYFITMSSPMQLILFGVISSVSIFLLHGKFKTKKPSMRSLDESEPVQIIEPIAPNSEGLVQYQGVPWTAINQSDITLTTKTRAIVIKTQGNKLIIKPDIKN